MIIEINKDVLLSVLSLASRFTSDKLTASTALQGVYLSGGKEGFLIYATNLNTYYQTTLKIPVEKDFRFVIEPRRFIEFLQFLQPGKITLEIKEKQVTLSQGKTKGNFPLMITEDFPTPPKMPEKSTKLQATFLTKDLPLVLFTASTDDARPALTGINFIVSEQELIVVSTDGFRLSYVKEKSKGTLSSMIIPADFLQEVLKNIGDEKEVGFSYSDEEKAVCFKVKEHAFYSRLIEGEFPPYERVIPVETKTTIVAEREEMIRNTKLVSVFARDFSNVVVCRFRKGEMIIRPKKEGNEENTAVQDIELKGEEQQVAFNFKYLLDFLNHINTKRVIIELLRPDAPVVFKAENNSNFFHIIMPVRIQE